MSTITQLSNKELVDKFFCSTINFNNDDEIEEIKNINEYVDNIMKCDLFTSHINDENRDIIRHDLIQRVQREVFVNAFKHWVKDNYNRELTNDEIVKLRSNFKTQNDFEPEQTYDERSCTHFSYSSVKPHSILDSFLSCDMVDSTISERLTNNLVVGLSKGDLTVPVWQFPNQEHNETDKPYIKYHDDSVWFKLLTEQDVYIAQEIVNKRAREQLHIFTEFLRKYQSDVQRDVDNSTKFSDIQNKLSENSEHFFNTNDDVITARGLDWNFKFLFTFSNCKEAYECIDFAKRMLYSKTNFSTTDWLFHKYAHELLGLCNVTCRLEEGIVLKKYPEEANAYRRSEEYNHKYNYC